MAASGEGHLEIVKFLIENGADVNVIDLDGWTPLGMASRGEGYQEIVKSSFLPVIILKSPYLIISMPIKRSTPRLLIERPETLL